MIYFHYLKFFKYILTLLVIYNIISLLVLFLPLKDLKNSFWKLSPYDYSYLIGYPNYLEKVSVGLPLIVLQKGNNIIGIIPNHIIKKVILFIAIINPSLRPNNSIAIKDL